MHSSTEMHNQNTERHTQTIWDVFAIWHLFGMYGAFFPCHLGVPLWVLVLHDLRALSAFLCSLRVRIWGRGVVLGSKWLKD